VAGAALLTLAATGCAGVQTLSYPPPPPTAALPVVTRPTLPNNLPSVFEAGVPGATTLLPPAIRPGSSTINGTVLGPIGPIGGASVEADRLVGDQEASVRTTTAADGSWSIPGILGGRYRVRAWQVPGLDLLSPQIFFLAAGQAESVTLQLASFTGPNVAAAIAPAAPVEGERDNLVVQVTNPTVGSDGVVRQLPAAGVSVALVDGPQWTVYNVNPRPAGPDGRVVFVVSCQGVGSVPLSVTVNSGLPTPLTLPGCAPGATTTTTTVPLFPCPSTTTSLPAGRPPSTTTTTSLFGLC
jgi:hypothetical protein